MALTNSQKEWILDNVEKATSSDHMAEMFNTKWNPATDSYGRQINGWILKLRRDGHIIKLHWRNDDRGWEGKEKQHAISLCIEKILENNLKKVADLLAEKEIVAAMARDLGRHTAHLESFIVKHGTEITGQLKHRGVDSDFTEEPNEFENKTINQQPIQTTVNDIIDTPNEGNPFTTPSSVDDKPEPETDTNEMDTKGLTTMISVLSGMINTYNPRLDKVAVDKLSLDLLTAKELHVGDKLGGKVTIAALLND